MKKTALVVEIADVASLAADPKNARLHDRRNLDTIRKSLERFGQQKPIVVTRAGVVIAGNGTLAAARELGWTEIAVVRTSLKGRDLTAFGLVDNRSSELAGWDDKELGALLAELQADEGYDHELAGWNDLEIDELLDDLASEGAGKASTTYTGEPNEPKESIVRYEIIFDTVAQQDEWFEFLRHLGSVYHEGTVAEKIVRYTRDHR